MSRTSNEPFPRSAGAENTRRFRFAGVDVRLLPTPRPLPEVAFSEVLEARKSSVGGPVSEDQLGDLLHHVCKRRRGGLGRFGHVWEGRASPSSGGLHVISLLCIPLEKGSKAGFYDSQRHCLHISAVDDALIERNAASAEALASATQGMTLQFMADHELLSSCYENSASLLWRDSGALAATIGLVAACLNMTSVTLGRTGDGLGLQDFCPTLQPVGAVHVGTRE